jgi:hypothetical protein
MNTQIFLCDECDCLASVSVLNDTITIQQCACLTLEWNI